jgi:lambda repressor-like predicted transcriptional regulator
MHPAEIRCALSIRGFSLSELARQLQVPPSLISMVVSNQRKTRKVRVAISRVLGLYPDQIWGDDEARKLTNSMKNRAADPEYAAFQAGLSG